MGCQKRLLLSVCEAEGQGSATGLAFLLKNNQVINEAKNKAVKALVKEIENQLTLMK